MKTITLINWCLLAIYTAILVGLLLFGRSGSTDDRMATGYVIMLFIPLGILAAINLVPNQVARMGVLVVTAGFGLLVIAMLIAGPMIQRYRQTGWAREGSAQADGSYYFHDAPRRRLAADIAAFDLIQLKADLSQPVPLLNATGRDAVTLLDFTAMQVIDRGPARLIAVFDLLLKHGAQIDNGDRKHTPTHFRVLGYGYGAETIQWMLEHGADANARSAETGFPILFHAVTGDNSDSAKAEKVKVLLTHGANPNFIPPKQDDRTIVTSMLLTAVDSDLWEIANLLIDFGADINYQTESGWNIHQAVAYQTQLFNGWNQTPPDEFARLAKRLQTVSGNGNNSKR